MNIENDILKAKRNKLPKQEKLTSLKQIEYLYKYSKSIFEYPIKFNWCVIDEKNKYWLNKNKEENPPIINIFATSKKYFKLAVKRNRAKRITKEIYRCNKHELYDLLKLKNKKAFVSWSYISKQEPAFEEIEKAMKIILDKAIQKLNNA